MGGKTSSPTFPNIFAVNAYIIEDGENPERYRILQTAFK